MHMNILGTPCNGSSTNREGKGNMNLVLILCKHPHYASMVYFLVLCNNSIPAVSYFAQLNEP